MADIKEAIQWMGMGLRVRRKDVSWGPADSIAPEAGGHPWSAIMYRIPNREIDERYISNLADLSADDWEIANESQMGKDAK